jgi:single-stranded DNA-specific DHH superfamily exonuclease
MDDAGAFAWTMEVGGVERVRRVKTRKSVDEIFEYTLKTTRLFLCDCVTNSFLLKSRISATDIDDRSKDGLRFRSARRHLRSRQSSRKAVHDNTSRKRQSSAS